MIAVFWYLQVLPGRQQAEVGSAASQDHEQGLRGHNAVTAGLDLLSQHVRGFSADGVREQA